MIKHVTQVQMQKLKLILVYCLYPTMLIHTYVRITSYASSVMARIDACLHVDIYICDYIFYWLVTIYFITPCRFVPFSIDGIWFFRSIYLFRTIGIQNWLIYITANMQKRHRASMDSLSSRDLFSKTTKIRK